MSPSESHPILISNKFFCGNIGTSNTHYNGNKKKLGRSFFCNSHMENRYLNIIQMVKEFMVSLHYTNWEEIKGNDVVQETRGQSFVRRISFF